MSSSNAKSRPYKKTIREPYETNYSLRSDVLYRLKNYNQSSQFNFRNSEKVYYFDELCFSKENKKTIPEWEGWNSLCEEPKVIVSSNDFLYRVCDLVNHNLCVMLHLSTMKFIHVGVHILNEFKSI